MEQPEPALPLLEEALAMAERLFAPTNPRIARYRSKLEECRAKLGR